MSKFKEKYLTDKDGHRVGVILDIDIYEGLMEDIEDLRMIADRKKESTLSFADVKKKLKKNGRL